MTPALTLRQRLLRHPHRFDGLQALRLAELGPEEGEADAAPIAVEAQRDLAFAAAPVTAIRGDRLRVAFLGLTGPVGVLPQVYSEMVHATARLRNTAFAAFLDMFNQRLVTLFLQASEKYRLPILLQRSAVDWPARRSPGPLAPSTAVGFGNDPVSAAVLAVAGLGAPHLRGRMAVPDEVVLFYAGLFAARTRPAGSLQAMLADYLGTDVTVEQFAGRWVPVAPAEQTRLPGPGEPPGFTALGVDTVAGARVWDVQGSFRIVIGPVRATTMRALMPDQPLLRRLTDLVRVYAGPDLAFDIQVILHRDDVPALQLAGPDAPDAQDAPRLGWNTWAKHLPALEHKRDIILDPDLVRHPEFAAGGPR